MKILPAWLREFAPIKADARRLADDLTLAGVAVESVQGEGDAAVYEMDITTNRVDAMNHYGVAREASAIYDVELRPIAPRLPPPRGDANIEIQIDDAQACARYTAQVVREVKIGPSSGAVAARFAQLEQKLINNAADATNHTLLEMGHPTHAFDMDLLAGGKIIVRRARDGESLKTLDGVDRKLHAEDLVIADAKKPVALAGVMGGFDSMITENTRNVLIESAWFDPATVRATARRHGMHTDASHRFERGADWGATVLACARVAELLLASGGELGGAAIDAIARRIERPTLALRRSEVRRILGQDIPEEEIARILRRLGFTVTAGAGIRVTTPQGAKPTGAGGTRAAVAEEHAEFAVKVPTWRLDVEREIDLIEEIARIHGFNRFPNTLPVFSGAVVEPADSTAETRLRSTLLALGYSEAISPTFISQQEAQTYSAAEAVVIANPLSEEAAVMRTSLLPGMVSMLTRNLNRGNSEVRLFEAGHSYEMMGSKTGERKVICMGATGAAQEGGVQAPPRAYTFFDMKGDIEALLAPFNIGQIYFDHGAAEYLHPGQSARVLADGTTIGHFGELHPDQAASRKIRQPIFVAEIQADKLFRFGLRQPRYQPLSRYPTVQRDFSFQFEATVTYERITALVAALRIPELREFTAIELLRGGAIPAGSYSTLLRASFQSGERTLRDDEVSVWSAQIIKALEAIGGKLRT